MRAGTALFPLDYVTRSSRAHRKAADSPFQAATALMLGASRALTFALLLGDRKSVV